eukprot:GHVQ01023053.1.p1 GENE.GHVQ01023053.1~~GHVQ01023053.1.p1  ORF type:complete len:191 (+),score=12.16 GHVQ01023053.1:350-922(+)
MDAPQSTLPATSNEAYGIFFQPLVRRACSKRPSSLPCYSFRKSDTHGRNDSRLQHGQMTKDSSPVSYCGSHMASRDASMYSDTQTNHVEQPNITMVDGFEDDCQLFQISSTFRDRSDVFGMGALDRKPEGCIDYDNSRINRLITSLRSSENLFHKKNSPTSEESTTLWIVHKHGGRATPYTSRDHRGYKK